MKDLKIEEDVHKLQIFDTLGNCIMTLGEHCYIRKYMECSQERAKGKGYLVS